MGSGGGQSVIARDQHDPAGPLRACWISRTYRRTAHSLQVLTLRDELGHEQTLRVTEEHPFHLALGGDAWVPAKSLAAGDTILGGDGTLSVVSNEPEAHPAGVTVYNLEVQDAHTYFVLAADAPADAEAVWVHNAKLAYRSLNEEDKIAILNGKGISREGGRRSHRAKVDTIGYGNDVRDTRYIPVTEEFNYLRNKSDYIEFRTGDVSYISMAEILDDKRLMLDLGSRARWVFQQRHALVSGQIPRNAMTKIVIGGKNIPV